LRFFEDFKRVARGTEAVVARSVNFTVTADKSNPETPMRIKKPIPALLAAFAGSARAAGKLNLSKVNLRKPLWW
jgi:hypothetical protein